MKRKITISIFAVLLFVLCALMSHLFDDSIVPSTSKDSKYDANMSYEAIYKLKDSNDAVQTVTVLIPKQNPAFPDNYFGTIEEQAYKEIIRIAKNRNIELPDHFEDDVYIYAVAK